MATRRLGSRSHSPTAPVIITRDGMAWCPVCGWEPDDDTRDPIVVRCRALDHRDACHPEAAR